MRAILRLYLLTIIFAFTRSALHADETLKLPLDLKVAAGQRERMDALVQFALPSKDAVAEPIRLIETTGAKQIPTAV